MIKDTNLVKRSSTLSNCDETKDDNKESAIACALVTVGELPRRNAEHFRKRRRKKVLPLEPMENIELGTPRSESC